jgi:hypothetical protein
VPASWSTYSFSAVLSVGFESETYTINEGDGRFRACVEIKDNVTGSLRVFADVSIVGDTATGITCYVDTVHGTSE